MVGEERMGRNTCAHSHALCRMHFSPHIHQHAPKHTHAHRRAPVHQQGRQQVHGDVHAQRAQVGVRHDGQGVGVARLAWVLRSREEEEE